MRRIVLTGAESTGKSTAAKALAEHYSAPLSSEFVRSYVDQLNRELTADDLVPIAEGQLALESDAAAKATSTVFHDTNILSSAIYAEHYFDKSVDLADQALANNPYTLYLLCDTDIPWIADDGQRESPETRDLLQVRFRQELEKRKLCYITLSGSIEDRLAKAIDAIDRLT